MKLLFFDVETTGLSAAKCAIHQLSGIIEIDGEIKERFNINIRPFTGAQISAKALEVSNVTAEQVHGYELDYILAHNKFKNLILKYVDKFDKKDKMFLVGYNSAAFDNHFLRGLFLRNSDKYFGSLFWPNPIDVYVLASYVMMDKRHEMPKFRLIEACKAFDIVVDDSKLHDAIYDVELTRSLFHKIKL